MIKVKKEISELIIETWSFCVIDNIIYLDSYVLAEKESTRHRKYQDLKRYERLSSREATIKEDQVPFSDDIRNEALYEYISTVKCLKWSEK